jgi:hypothetical protein
MSSKDWKRTKTAGRMPMRRSLEEQSELVEDIAPALPPRRDLTGQAQLAMIRPLDEVETRVPIITTWTGELARIPAQLDAAQLQAIETLAAMCALLGEIASAEEVIEVEARADGLVLNAVALDRRFIFMDYLAPGATREALRQRAQHELSQLGGGR